MTPACPPVLPAPGAWTPEILAKAEVCAPYLGEPACTELRAALAEIRRLRSYEEAWAWAQRLALCPHVHATAEEVRSCVAERLVLGGIRFQDEVALARAVPSEDRDDRTREREHLALRRLVPATIEGVRARHGEAVERLVLVETGDGAMYAQDSLSDRAGALGRALLVHEGVRSPCS